MSSASHGAKLRREPAARRYVNIGKHVFFKIPNGVDITVFTSAGSLHTVYRVAAAFWVHVCVFFTDAGE